MCVCPRLQPHINTHTRICHILITNGHQLSSDTTTGCHGSTSTGSIVAVKIKINQPYFMATFLPNDITNCIENQSIASKAGFRHLHKPLFALLAFSPRFQCQLASFDNLICIRSLPFFFYFGFFLRALIYKSTSDLIDTFYCIHTQFNQFYCSCILVLSSLCLSACVLASCPCPSWPWTW